MNIEHSEAKPHSNTQQRKYTHTHRTHRHTLSKHTHPVVVYSCTFHPITACWLDAAQPGRRLTTTACALTESLQGDSSLSFSSSYSSSSSRHPSPPLTCFLFFSLFLFPLCNTLAVKQKLCFYRNIRGRVQRGWGEMLWVWEEDRREEERKVARRKWERWRWWEQGKEKRGKRKKEVEKDGRGQERGRREERKRID